MQTLIAEDLLLLLLNDETGALSLTTFLAMGLGGAMLVELAREGRVEVVKGSGRWPRAKVRLIPVSAAPLDDPVLAQSLNVVGEKERTAQDLVGRLGKGRKVELLERLEAKGVIARRRDKVLGLFPRTRWPAVDATHKAQVRRSLGDALVHGVTPDERTAALVGLLSAMDLAHKVVDRQDRPAREIKRRAKEIAEGDWAAKGVKDAIAAAQAAMAAGAFAATSVAGSS